MNLIERAQKIANGIDTLIKWVGMGGTVVSQELAQSRTNACVSCPLNKDGGKLTEAVARAIKTQMELKNKLGLKTRGIKSLKTCSVCQCYMPLKIWIPLEYVMRHTEPEEMNAFADGCWIRTENGL